jgi:tryptophan synthase alpha chain
MVEGAPGGGWVTARLAAALLAVKATGGKAFVPYVTGGFPGVDTALLRALVDAGADALEIGLPFSDPAMDGPVIQEASRRALEAGTTADAVFELISRADLPVPVAIMTYVNPILAYGQERFAADAAAAGVTGFIVPDLPVDEADAWLATCTANDQAPVMLAAPNSSPDRLKRIAGASKGFVYCVATFGVTGARTELGDSARTVVEALRPLTETPLLVGVGVSTPEQATAAVAFADGAVVGSALVEPLLAGDPTEMLRRAVAFRAAMGAEALRAGS